jgi:Uncharacterised nucleotidyltransferase
MNSAVVNDPGHRHPPAEVALLITSLRGLPFDVPRDTDWNVLLQLATANGVLSLLHQSLSEKAVAMPESFTAAARESRDTAETFAAGLKDLLQHFAEHAIEVIPLKGPVLAASLYGDVAMRACNDLDLLVRPADYQRAEALLFDLGFAALTGRDDYHRRFLRDALLIELHFGVSSPRYFPFDPRGVWIRASGDKFRGMPMRIMSDGDLVLYLCLHGVKHGFSRLIWILDLAHALQGMQRGGLEDLIRRAQREGLEPWLLMGCEVVREMFPDRLPKEMDALIAASPEVAAKARDSALQLFAEGLETVNDHKLRSFYLHIERSARKRWRCRLTYFWPSVEDYKWAERNRIHRRFAPILRPLRLLQKYGPSRVWQIVFPSRM